MENNINTETDDQSSETPLLGGWGAKPLGDGADIELRSEEVQEVLGNVPHWILRRGIIVLAVFLVALLVGSWFFKYPEIISSQLTLTTTNPPANIVAKTGGKISALFVKDTQNVFEGTPLAVIENPANLDDVLFLSSTLPEISESVDNGKIYRIRRKELKLGGLQSSFSNLLVQLENYNNFITLNYYPRKIASIKSVLSAREKLLESSEKQKGIVVQQHNLEKKSYQREQTLKAKNITSDDNFEKATGKYLQSEMSVNNITASLDGMKIEILQLREALVDMEHQYIEKKNNLETGIKSILNQLQSDITAWKMNYLLVSPIAGKVAFTEIWSVNQNVTGGKVVFTVLPDTVAQLVGKAKLPINRSGKVNQGQEVNIRFNNFPDNQFGMVKGVVKNISLIPTEDGNYIVEVSFPVGLKTTYNKTLPLSQEMTARADIITEDTRLLEQFFLPLKRVLKNQ